MEQETKQEFKTFSLEIDMVRTIGQPPFEVVWGDTGNLLHILLTNDGVPIDLTGAYVCVVFRSSIGTALQDETNGLTLSETAGELTLRLLPESYGAGDVSADIQVYTGEDRETLITSRRFTFRCRNALLNDKTMQANGTYPPLISATHAATEAARIALAAAENNGDMHRSVYDADADGVVNRADSAASADHALSADAAENADCLGGNPPEHYATAESVEAISPASIGAIWAKKATVSLPAASWNSKAQTVTVNGVTAANDLLVAANPSCLEAWNKAGVYASAQTANTITFNCTTVPTAALTANIMILEGVTE